MTVTRSLLFLIVAIICFAVAVVALGSLASNYDAWLAGGLLSYALSALP